MNSVATNSLPGAASQAGTTALPIGQWVLLFLLLGAGGLWAFATLEEALLAVVLVLYFVAITGLFLCHTLRKQLDDPGLDALGYFWLIKLAFTFVLLYAGWMPQLDRVTSTAWGYDPQRYYVEAQQLVENDWSPQFVSVNYVGVLYFYGAIFWALGRNPLIPALINGFITLLGTLYLVKVCYELKGRREPGDWTLATVLLLPEMVWFDVLTSRETLLATLVIITLLTIGRYLLRSAPLKLSTVLIVSGLSTLAIAAVRTSMLLPVSAAIILMTLLVRATGGGQLGRKMFLATVAAAFLIGAPLLAVLLGAYDFDILSVLDAATSANAVMSTSTELEWSQNSIGMLLIPESPLQSLLFLVPRMVIYLVAPLPNLAVPIQDLAQGSWSAWQKLSSSVTSVINVFAVPCVLAALATAIRVRRRDAAPLVLQISFWVTFLAIAGGNLIIVERYRVMATPLMWACAWMGTRAEARRQIPKMFLAWFGALALGGAGYLFLKIL